MTRPMRLQAPTGRALHIAVCSLCLWLALTPHASAEVTADDPVVADVVRMLDAGLEPRLVLSWLEAGNKRPAPLTANDMLALAAAEAPAELIEDLLGRATQPAEVEPAPPAAPPVSRAPKDDPLAQEVDSGDCCLVDFSVEYRAPEQGVGDEVDQPRGDLYLYIDGQFVGRFEPRGEIAGAGPLTFKRRLAQGGHTIRLTRELHLPSRNRDAADARDHRTTVSPSSIEFEVKPGAQWNMDIRWVQGVFSRKRPLQWRWSKNGVPVAGEKNVGAFHDDWSFLCDDVEISRDSGAIAGWRASDRSRDCVTWASLWPQGVESSRAQILAAFEESGFRPEIHTVGSLD